MSDRATPPRAASPADRRAAYPSLPDGTRVHLPDAASAREALVARLRALYASWGYRVVEVPALERYDQDHPRAAQAFKLIDRDGGPLALRSDFTPALARLVGASWPRLADPDAQGLPVRLQYAGPVWHAIDPELARTREFTQVGVELVGASHPRTDAELIHLARESVRTAGLAPRVELGSPGFVRALMDDAGVPDRARPALADAMDRKDPRGVADLVHELGLPREAASALRAVPDLYGGTDLLRDARGVVLGDASRRALERLEGVLAEFEDDSELILDLGMARRLSYYTGVTFRAYTTDFGQPLLGGGRYDGALLPYAAGFSLGLERLLAALPPPHPGERARVLSTDDAGARRLRRAGVAVLRAVAGSDEEARAEGRSLGVAWLLGRDGLRPLADDADAAEGERLAALLEDRGV